MWMRQIVLYEIQIAFIQKYILFCLGDNELNMKSKRLERVKYTVYFQIKATL